MTAHAGQVFAAVARGLVAQSSAQNARAGIRPARGQRGRSQKRIGLAVDFRVDIEIGPALLLWKALHQVGAERGQKRLDGAWPAWLERFVQVARHQPQRLRRVGKTPRDQRTGRLGLKPPDRPGQGRVGVGGLEMAGEDGERPGLHHQAVAPEERQVGRVGDKPELRGGDVRVRGQPHRPARKHRQVQPAPVIAGQAMGMGVGRKARRRQELVVEPGKRVFVENLLQQHKPGIGPGQKGGGKAAVGGVERRGLVGFVAVARTVKAGLSMRAPQAQVLDVEAQDPHGSMQDGSARLDQAVSKKPRRNAMGHRVRRPASGTPSRSPPSPRFPRPPRPRRAPPPRPSPSPGSVAPARGDRPRPRRAGCPCSRACRSRTT